jgi:hypothetical protein
MVIEQSECTLIVEGQPARHSALPMQMCCTCGIGSSGARSTGHVCTIDSTFPLVRLQVVVVTSQCVTWLSGDVNFKRICLESCVCTGS